MSGSEHTPIHSFGTEECTFAMTLPSASKEITKVESFLLEANKKLLLDDGTMYRLLVAVTEAVNNAIIHGNDLDASKPVDVCLKATRTKISITVRDQGKGFDPSSLPNPLEQENLLKDHGRGVFLIRSLVDTVEFASGEEGSTITMTVDLELLR